MTTIRWGSVANAPVYAATTLAPEKNSLVVPSALDYISIFTWETRARWLLRYYACASDRM